MRPREFPPLVVGKLVLPLAPHVCDVRQHPVQTTRPERSGLGKGHEAAGDVVAHVVEVRVHRVGAAAEVQIVRVEEAGGVAELAGHVQTEGEEGLKGACHSVPSAIGARSQERCIMACSLAEQREGTRDVLP